MNRIPSLPHLRKHLATAALSVAVALLAAACTATAPPRAPAVASRVPATPTTRQALAARIDALIGQPRYAGADWGIAVVSLDSGRTLYAHRAERLFQPASTAKLYTAALALDLLGADYRIPTRLLGAGPIRHGRLDGSLILYGMGDPTLGTAGISADWADQLASQLVARGVHRVRGDLIADASYFIGPATGSGWEADDLQSAFAAPASALSVNENTVSVTVQPAPRAGEPARLSLVPADAMPAVAGTLTTGTAGTPDDINLYRAPGSDTLHVFGSVPMGAPTRTFKLAAPDPARLAGEQLRQALARHDVRVDGILRVARWPQDEAASRANAATLAEVLSPPLIDVLTRGLKRSQNLYLQNLLLIAGVKAEANAKQAGTPPAVFLGSEDWGIRALRQLLDRIGIAPSDSLLKEGTGLSRQDLITPAALVHLLQYFAAQPYAAQLRDALPVAGVDGTLAWRMRDTPAAGNVHAKTGSMHYVDSLAGYVTSASGERLAFAILLNNDQPPADTPRANRDLDAIAELLAGFRGRE